jgi:hypothetical protein
MFRFQRNQKSTETYKEKKMISWKYDCNSNFVKKFQV